MRLTPSLTLFSCGGPSGSWIQLWEASGEPATPPGLTQVWPGRYMSPTSSLSDPPAIRAPSCQDEVRKADLSLYLSSPGAGLDLTALSLPPPEYNSLYSKCSSMARHPCSMWDLRTDLGGSEAAVGDPLFHDQIPVIAGPCSYLLTRRRGLQLPAKNNCAVPHKYWET